MSITSALMAPSTPVNPPTVTADAPLDPVLDGVAEVALPVLEPLALLDPVAFEQLTSDGTVKLLSRRRSAH